jgi:hypothetical protein
MVRFHAGQLSLILKQQKYMADKQNKKYKFRLSSSVKDLAILAVISVFIFTLSYLFDVFKFLVEFFQKQPRSIVWVDEIITGLLTLSIGFGVFSWRRFLELKKETAERIRLQEELIKIAETKAETERIICKQLHCDIEEYRKAEKNALLRHYKAGNNLSANKLNP